MPGPHPPAWGPPGGLQLLREFAGPLPLAQHGSGGNQLHSAVTPVSEDVLIQASTSPLIPMPITDVPFEQVGMSLAGPLPKSTWGHEYILVLVDYATRYPEVVPLHKATLKNIA